MVKPLRYALPALALLAGLVPASKALAQYSFVSLVQSGQAAPGGGTFGTTSTTFSSPAINGSGDIIIRGVTSSAAGYYQYDANGNGARLLQQGDSIPTSAGGGTFNSVNAGMSFSNDDSLTFVSTTTGGAATGLFRRDSSGNITSLALRGRTAAGGTSGGTYNSIAQYRGGSNGTAIFQATISNGVSAEQGLFRQVAGGAVVRIADNVSGSGLSAAPGEGRFTAFAPGGITSTGQAAFFASITNNLNANQGLYMASPDGTISRLAVQGDSVPGFAGAAFSVLTRPAISETGIVAFRGQGTDSSSNRQGIFTINNGTLTNIAIGNQLAPGGGTFDAQGFSLITQVADSGALAFTASLVGGGNTLFSYYGGSLSRVLGVGDALFGDSVSFLGQPVMDNAGNIAIDYALGGGQRGVFLASLTSSAVTAPEPVSIGFMLICAGSAAGIGVLRRRTKRTSEAA